VSGEINYEVIEMEDNEEEEDMEVEISLRVRAKLAVLKDKADRSFWFTV